MENVTKNTTPVTPSTTPATKTQTTKSPPATTPVRPATMAMVGAKPPYTLPKLDYEYTALEPHMSKRVLELHHDKHHRAYVDNANATLMKLEEARAQNDFARIPMLERLLAFNVSGHILHSIFWKNLSPKGGGRPTGVLAAAIDRDLGGFDSFKKQMNAVAGSIMGSGWAALVWEPMSAKLMITQIYDHQSNQTQGGIPFMVLDAWEHAYYLQYENRKSEFFAAIWNLWDWNEIGQRFIAATEAKPMIGLS